MHGLADGRIWIRFLVQRGIVTARYNLKATGVPFSLAVRLTMGWQYRRSASFGPFRVNLSRSGIGYSVGGRGFRTGVSAGGRRYSSVGIPGTGLRYYSGGGRSRRGCLVVLAIGIATTWLARMLLS